MRERLIFVNLRRVFSFFDYHGEACRTGVCSAITAAHCFSLNHRELGVAAIPPMKHVPEPLESVLKQVRACRLCEPHLPLGPRPVLRAASTARLLVVGQAPGRRVHETGIPFNDPSGDRLREWLGVDRETFYDEERVAIIPMGFCYPGTGKSGDLPPKTECAEAWRGRLMA